MRQGFPLRAIRFTDLKQGCKETQKEAQKKDFQANEPESLFCTLLNYQITLTLITPSIALISFAILSETALSQSIIE